MDTIAAVATGQSACAIGIIRISGPDTLDIISRVFRGSINTEEFENRKLYYGKLLSCEGDTLDMCLCTVSRAPHSYTGEDTAELQCHGSPMVMTGGLRAVCAAGARLAGPGEFTKRAFLNGRMDLTQAEAVIDLIDAETEAAAKNAAGQLGGAVAKKTDAIYDALIDMASHFHAVIDYPDEDIEDFEMAEYSDLFAHSEAELTHLLSTFEHGRIMKNGVLTAIIGRPNVGKSSLLNALLGYERAIVTDLPGTTRDTIEEKITLGGVLLRLTDTAGIRETEDIVENIGVERAKKAAEDAELVIAVTDGTQPLCAEDIKILKTAALCKNAVCVISKSDIGTVITEKDITPYIENVCVISSKTGEGLDKLQDMISRLFSYSTPKVWGEMLTNARHADAVSRALGAIKSARQALMLGIPPDAVLTDTEYAMAALGELSGKTVRQDVTDRIFDRFCVGK